MEPKKKIDAAQAAVVVPIIQARLKNELDLVAHRMGWLVTSQSFLFGGVILGTTSDLSSRPTTTHALQLVPVLAIAIAIAVWLGVVAALRMTHILGQRLQSLDEHLALHASATKRESSWTNWSGNVPPLVVPPLLACCWVDILQTTWEQYGASAHLALIAGVEVLFVVIGYVLVRGEPTGRYEERVNSTQPRTT